MSITPNHGGHATAARPLFISQQLPPVPPPAPPLPPPPAPPLPSARYVQRAATAFGRLAHPFFLGSRPSSAQGHREREGRLETRRPAGQRHASPVSSKSTSHKTGIPIAALDISPERTHAVLAGRDILKTVKVSGSSCAEDFNLRAKLSAYASTHHASRDAIAAQHRDQLAAKDVKWSSGNYSTTIATAAANGRIVVYDLNRPSIEIGRLHEHTRQVHKLAYNPANPALLISGSQDGSVRMWDMRDLRTDRAVRITGCFRRFMGHSEGVRDVKWSPSDSVEFAAGTDAGTIQRWDMRKENAPLLKLNAHDKTCMSLDWHPSGRYLASGSADKTIKVWDFRSTDRRMKPNWQLRAPQSVMNIKWRLSNGSSSETGRPSTYLASSYDNRDPRIHIWDFRRPHVPFQEIDRYDTSATDFLWHSEDLLWSVGVTGMFTQTDLNFVPKPLDRVSVNVLATGPEAEFCFFSQYRSVKRQPLADAEEQFLRGSGGGRESGEKLSGSHSANEGSYDETSNQPTTLKKHRQKQGGFRTNAEGSTKSGRNDDIKLSDSFSLDALFRSTQSAAVGSIFGVFESEAFKTLAIGYKYPELAPRLTDEELLASIQDRFEQNADVATATAQYRLSQTWRILGNALYTELMERLKFLRMDQTSRQEPGATASTLPPTSAASFRSPIFSHSSEVAKALQGLSSLSESGSNVATPLARPVREMPSIALADEHYLENDTKPTFKPPPWGQRRSSVQVGDSSTFVPDPADIESKARGVPDPHPLPDQAADFPDLEIQMQERRTAMNNYRARPRTLLRLDNNADDTPSLGTSGPHLERHDSNESFQMFSGSTDSDPRSIALTGSFGDQSIDNSATNSLTSSAAHDFTLGHDVHHSQSRQSHASKLDQNESFGHRVIDSASSSLLDDVTFPIDHEDNKSEVKEAEVDSLPVIRPKLVPPVIHPVTSAQGESDKTSRVVSTSLLMSHPLSVINDSPPWSVSALLPPLLEYHLEILCDPQLPSFLALFLYPLCPALFANSPPPPTYLLAYHEMLISLRLFPEAAALRRAASSIFPDMGLETTVDQGRRTNADRGGLWCDVCRRPVKGDIPGWCKRCCKEWAECAICELSHPPAPSDLKVPCSESLLDSESDAVQSTILWSWCQGCGHGGHTRCLKAWWHTGGDSTTPDLSGGSCPTVGCNHACVAGPRRDARLAVIAAANKRTRGSSVARDSWIAGESRAVEAATKTLGSGRNSAGSGGIAPGLASGLGVPAGISSSGRVSLEEAVVVEEADRSGSAEPTTGSAGTTGSFVKGRSLSGGGRSLSGGGRRVRLVVPSTTPPAAATAVAGLRDPSASGWMEPLPDEGSDLEPSYSR